MRQTKLIETLRTFTARERSRWQQYVHSNFFNKNVRLRQCCDYVLARAPEFSDDSLHKKQVFEHLFGKAEPYDELKTNNLISDLYELLLGFLAHNRQKETDPLNVKYHSLMALIERNLDKQAAAELEKYCLLLNRRPDRTADWYRHEMRMWEAGEMLHSRQPRRTASEHLHRQAEAVRNTHALEKLRLNVALLSRNALAVLGTDDNHRSFDDLQRGQPSTPGLPAAEVYQAAQNLIREPMPETYIALMSTLDVHFHIFKKEELAALYQCALNYCIRRINDGHPGAYVEALSLYRTLLESGLLLQRGRLSQWTYKNIATAGLRSGEFDWTEDFLLAYRDTLLPTERDNAFAFNMATLYFEKQDFARALQTLQNVEFSDVTYHVGAKIMQLKAFYLLNETEALYSLLEAAEQLLRRNKSLSAFGKTTNLNFLRMLRQINQWRQKQANRSAEKIEQGRLGLLEKVAQLQPLANKDWLLKILTFSPISPPPLHRISH